jgi:hypothetical protein
MTNLPGSIRRISPGEHTCEHRGCTLLATHSLQGETDSFGAEYRYYCTAHIENERQRLSKASRVGTCDWCKGHATDLRPHRDFEEGSNGPVYEVCGDCVRKQIAEVQDELEDCYE